MYEKIKLMLAENYGLVIAVLTAVLFLCVSLLCRDYLHNNSNGSSAAQVQLQQAIGTQQSITEGVQGAEREAQAIREQVNSARENAGQIDRNLKDAGAIIEDCQRILRQVEQRPQTSK